MPYRNVRGVNRGVQDEEELQKIQQQEKKKRREKAKKWCMMIGLTVIEFVLCLICFGLGYYYYHTTELYMNNLRGYSARSVRSMLERPAPLAIASVFLTLTYVDLVSWHSLRPVTYFGWIMVASAGFLMFLLYAGCIILTCNAIHAYIAIVFGCITALVFLADLICMLMSLKRFPVPYWVLKRKYEKLDQCVCTGDYDPEEEEVERPICRCGDHWGEPCTCDDPDLTCGCGADKRGKPPCECCECAAQALVTDDTDGTTVYGSLYDGQSMVSTMTGREELEERRKTIYSQVSLPMEQYCAQLTPGRYCVDGPAPSPLNRSTFTVTPSMADPYSRQEAVARKSVAAQSQITEPRKSTILARQSMASPSRITAASTMPEAMPSPSMAASSRFQSMAASSRLQSMAAPSKIGTTMSQQKSSILTPSGLRGIGSPSMMQAAKHGGLHGTLNETIGAPSMALASRMAMNKSQKSVLNKNKSEMVYSVYTTTVDDEETIQESIASKYGNRKQYSHKSNPKFGNESGQAMKAVSSRSSTDDEIGAEGDYPRKRAAMPSNVRHHSRKSQKKPDRSRRLRFTTYTATERCAAKLDPELGYMSDPEILQGPHRIYTLPGQVSSLDDTDTYKYCSTKKNVSVSARERCSRRTTCSARSPSTFRVVSEHHRPRSTAEGLAPPRIIRNVSTTVRAVRTLSRVMEAENESRSVSQSDHKGSDRFPSECTITINKT